MKPIFPDNFNEKDGDLVLAYLREELTDSQKSEVDSRRKTDPVFNDLFIAHVKLAAATRLSDLDAKRAMLQTHAKNQKPVPSIATGRIIRIAAACVILGLIFGVVYKYVAGKPNEVFLAHFSTAIYPAPGELSGDVQSIAADAYRLYNKGEFAAAARSFEQLMSKREDPTDNVYAAISHLATGNTQRTIELIDQVHRENRIPKAESELILLHALALVRDNEFDDARNYLEGYTGIMDQHPEIRSLYMDLQK